MKKLIVTLIAALWATALFASQPTVEVDSTRLPDNSLAFTSKVTGFGKITIEVKLTGVTNATLQYTGADVESFLTDGEAYSPICRVGAGTTELFVLKSVDPSQPVRAKFSWSWLQGEIGKPYDEKFTYRIPVAVGKKTDVSLVSAFDAGQARDYVVGFRMFQFSMAEGEMVYAARSGEVMRVDGFDPRYANEEYVAMANRIYILHEDGTIAQYACLSAAQVAEGDTVSVGAPIARAGRVNDGRWGVRLAVYNYVPNRNIGYADQLAVRSYIDPYFRAGWGKRQLDAGDHVKAKAVRYLPPAVGSK